MSKGVKGLSSLFTKLNKIGGNSAITIEKSLGKNIKLIQGEAKELCPVGEVSGGRLRDSINTRVDIDGSSVKGIVYTNVEYAAYVEFGTGQRGAASPSPPKSDADISYREDWVGMDAKPYLYPALKNNEDKVRGLIKKDIEKAIKEVAKK